MQKTEDVKIQLQNLGDATKNLLDRKELKYLPEILMKSETIKGVISGFLLKKTRLVVCTSKRILIMHRGLFWGFEFFEIPLDKITNITSEVHSFTGSISFWGEHHPVTISRVWRGGITDFVEAANLERERIRKQNGSGTPAIEVVS